MQVDVVASGTAISILLEVVGSRVLSRNTIFSGWEEASSTDDFTDRR